MVFVFRLLILFGLSWWLLVSWLGCCLGWVLVLIVWGWWLCVCYITYDVGGYYTCWVVCGLVWLVGWVV